MAYEAVGTAIAAAASTIANIASKNWNKIKSWFGGSKTRTAAQWQNQYNNVNSILLNNALNPATKSAVNWNSIANFVTDIWDYASPYIFANKLQKQTNEDAIAAQERQYQYELMGLGVQNEYNLKNMAKQYQYNKILQQDAQQWQQMMSNTAHQRERADLEAAGLNPLLSVNNGAATGTVGAGSVGLGQAGDISVGLTNEYNQRIAGWQTALQMKAVQNQLKDSASNRALQQQQIAELESKIQKNIADRDYTELMNNLGAIKLKYADKREKKEIDKIIQDIDYQKGMLSVEKTKANIMQQKQDIESKIGYTALDLNKKMAEYYEHLKRKYSIDNVLRVEGKIQSGSGAFNTNFGIGKGGINIGIGENHSFNKY